MKRHIRQTWGAEHKEANLALGPLIISFFPPHIAEGNKKEVDLRKLSCLGLKLCENLLFLSHL